MGVSPFLETPKTSNLLGDMEKWRNGDMDPQDHYTHTSVPPGEGRLLLPGPPFVGAGGVFGPCTISGICFSLGGLLHGKDIPSLSEDPPSDEYFPPSDQSLHHLSMEPLICAFSSLASAVGLLAISLTLLIVSGTCACPDPISSHHHRTIFNSNCSSGN